MDKFHQPVMVKKVLSFLNVNLGSWYIDSTLGGGGYTEEILKLGGRVLGVDLDQDSINYVRKNLYKFIKSGQLTILQGNFSNLKKIVDQNLNGKISGILFDLGVSSHQLETIQRGFSFSKDAPLDMRMDQRLNVSAEDLINGLYEGELAELFSKYGEEKLTKKIAKKIVEERKKKRIETTLQLTNIILSAKPRNLKDRIHPATKIFQALRIAVNDELNNLQKGLPQAVGILSPGGRVVVISFHSLEDRIVKNIFNNLETKRKVKILTPKPITPSTEEVASNPRSRSAKLRSIEVIE